MSSLPVNFQAMADVKLVVEGVELPAHKTILAANSKVFADLFTSQAVAASSQSEVPLPDESLQDTTIALTYLYRNCIFQQSAQSLDCLEDAEALIRFGHKYGMQGMLNATEAWLIPQVAPPNPDEGMLLGTAAIASWTAIAEKYGLRKLLAHCEDFMIKNEYISLWHDEALVREEVSRASLLRVLRGLQWSRLCTRESPYSAPPAEKYDVDIPTLLEWQKSDAASENRQPYMRNFCP